MFAAGKLGMWQLLAKFGLCQLAAGIMLSCATVQNLHVAHHAWCCCGW